jgi:hypothetical protein
MVLGVPTSGDPYSTAFLLVAFVIVGAPVVFGLIVVAAVLQRRRTGRVGGTLTELLAASGGFVLGSLLLLGPDPRLLLPVFGAIAFLVVTRWRRGRRVQAGWLLAGSTLPWTLLWGWSVVQAVGRADLDLSGTVARFAVGVAWLAVGLAVARRGDPPVPVPTSARTAARPRA